jgi:hypothetical protein
MVFGDPLRVSQGLLFGGQLVNDVEHNARAPHWYRELAFRGLIKAHSVSLYWSILPLSEI